MKTIYMPYVLVYLIILSIGLAYGVYKFNKLTTINKLLVLLLGATLASEIPRVLFDDELKDNSINYYIFVIAGVLINYFIYRNEFLKFKKSVRPLGLITLVIIAVCLFSLFFIHGTSQFPTIPVSFNFIYCIILSLTSFVYLLQSPRLTPLFKESFFLFNMGNLFYYSISFFSMSMRPVYYKFDRSSIEEVRLLVYDLPNVVLWIFYLLCFYALIVNKEFYPSKTKS